MPRTRKHITLRVLLNNRLVGHLLKEPGGAIYFQYDKSWLALNNAVPVSLSLPLREDTYRGEQVDAVFENLLPDSDKLRQRIAEKVGAAGIDAYSLLSRIGRDCVGALQFVPEGENALYTPGVDGQEVSDEEIEKLLNNLVRTPLGLDQDQDFRISVAGAQEKTSLLYYNGIWWKPRGTTPTTHILKTQIGTLPNGLDLSNSVENEYYCLKLLAAFGLPVTKAEIKIFGKTKALVIERFDRQRIKDGRILRLPQEDFCQALSCPPARKYQNQGGPGIVDILNCLKGADTPEEDQKIFLKAQILFWLIGATDGHAKNFSIFLGRGGAFHLAPIYDVLTAQPSVDSRRIERKQMKLAMSVGDGRHYKIDDIEARHFIQSARRANLPGSLANDVLQEIARTAGKAMASIEQQLPAGIPKTIHHSVIKGMESRLPKIWN